SIGIGTGKRIGTIMFGGNHTDSSESNILYPASIAGVANNHFSSATSMPTDLVFYTGSIGRTATVSNVSSGEERLRMASNGDFGLNDTSPTAHASGNNTVLSIKGKGSSYSGKIDFKDSDGKLHTHTPDSFLDGITRRTIIEIAKSKNIEVIKQA
ncbi:MAG: hypothetical protein VX026_14235, partial [Myxococcota bacterium]|nr:hypothetical protein [Myxococcota bacterium]